MPAGQAAAARAGAAPAAAAPARRRSCAARRHLPGTAGLAPLLIPLSALP